MSVRNEISRQQSDALDELKERMKGDLEKDMYDDEHFLRRFLKARNFNVDNAEKMLRKHLDWRLKNDLENIFEFKKNEDLEKYFSYTIIGYDNEGCVVRYSPVGNVDYIGFAASCKFNYLLKRMLYETETETEELKKQSEKLGRNVDKCVYVFNVENLTFAQATDKKNLSLLLQFSRIFQNNYPERLKIAFFINVSLYFSFVYNMLKPVLEKSILEKVQIFSDDRYKEELLKVGDADQLPAFLGGTKTDPDGNPLCITLINQAGPIPEKYYLQKSKKALSKAPGVEKGTLPRAAFHEVKLEVREPNSYLEWEFETKCSDIGFGLFYQDTSDDERKMSRSSQY